MQEDFIQSKETPGRLFDVPEIQPRMEFDTRVWVGGDEISSLGQPTTQNQKEGESMFVMKNRGLVRSGENLVITGAVLSDGDVPEGVNILLGVDTMGGIYLINRASGKAAIFVNNACLADRVHYFNAPEFDRIEIATGKGSYFLHFRRLLPRDLAPTVYAAMDVTHYAHISTSENPHTERIDLLPVVAQP